MEFVNTNDPSIHPEDVSRFIEILLEETKEYMDMKGISMYEVGTVKANQLWDLARTRLELELVKSSTVMLRKIINNV